MCVHDNIGLNRNVPDIHTFCYLNDVKWCKASLMHEYFSKVDYFHKPDMNLLALLYNFTSVYTNIPSCRRDESKTSFPLQEGIFVYS